jgi:hypothetical protein
VRPTAWAEVTARGRRVPVEDPKEISEGPVEPEQRSAGTRMEEGSRSDIGETEKTVIGHQDLKGESNMDIMQKWADDTSDIAVTEQDTVDPPQELVNTGKEWPTLTPYDDTRSDTKTKPTHQDTNNKDGSERRPLVNRPTSCDTTALMDKAGSGSTRIKKQRLSKSSENLNDRKRTRNRAPTPVKDEQ